MHCALSDPFSFTDEIKHRGLYQFSYADFFENATEDLEARAKLMMKMKMMMTMMILTATIYYMLEF